MAKKISAHSAALNQLQYLGERFEHHARNHVNLCHYEIFGNQPPSMVIQSLGCSPSRYYLGDENSCDESQFYGDLELFEEFWELAEKAAECLNHLQPPFSAHLRAIGEHDRLVEKILRDVPGGGEHWVRVLYVLAWFFPSPLLRAQWYFLYRTRNPQENNSQDTEDDGQTFQFAEVKRLYDVSKRSPCSDDGPWGMPPNPPVVSDKLLPCRVDLATDVFTSSVNGINLVVELLRAGAERQTPRRRRSRRQDDAIVLLSALVTHHRFQTDNPRHEPATQAQLVALTGWNQSKVSRVMQALLGGMTAYKQACKTGNIGRHLSRLDGGEVQPNTEDFEN